MGDVVREITNKNVFLVDYFYFVFAVTQLDRFTDIKSGKDFWFGLINKGNNFGFTRFFDEADCLGKRIQKAGGFVGFKTGYVIFGNLVVRIDGDDVFKSIFSFFAFANHRVGDTQSIKGADVFGICFQDFFV